MATSVGEIEATLRLRDELSGQLKVAQQSLTAFSSQMTSMGQGLQKVGSQFTQVGIGLTAGLTLPIVGAFTALIKSSADFQSAFANVRKTIGNVPELPAIREGLRGLSRELPQSVVELSEFAALGGQFGISAGGILDFTKTVAALDVAVDGLSGAEAAESLAQLRTATGGTEASINNMAAALVALGNDGASSEKQILEFAQRLGESGPVIGISQSEIFALGATMANLGINAERGSTAMQKTMLQMLIAVENGGRDLEAFGRIAGTSGAQFAETFKGEPIAAIGAFIDGLGRMKNNNESVVQALQGLDVEATRQVGTLLSLMTASQNVSTSQGNLAANVTLAGNAYQIGNAHLAEAAVKNETFWNQLKRLGNTLEDVLRPLGDGMVEALTALIQNMGPVVRLLDAMVAAFNELPTPLKAVVGGFIALTALVGPMNLWVGMTARGFGSIIELTGTLAGKIPGLTKAWQGLMATMGLGQAASFASLGTQAVAGAKGLDAVKTAADSAGKTLKFAAGEQLGLGFATVAARNELGQFTPRIWAAQQALLPLSGALEQTAATAPKIGILGQAMRLVSSIFSSTAATIGGLVLGTAALVAAVAKLSGQWETLTSILGGVPQVLTDIGRIIRSTVIAAIDEMISKIAQEKQAVMEFINWFKNLIPDAMKNAEGGMSFQFVPILGDMERALRQAGKSFPDFKKNLHQMADTADMAAGQFGNLSNESQTFAEWAGTAVAGPSGKPKAAGAAPDKSTSPFADQLKAARAEVAALSDATRTDLVTAMQSGKFSLEELAKSSGLSDLALKTLQGTVKEGAKPTKFLETFKNDLAELDQKIQHAQANGVPMNEIVREFGEEAVKAGRTARMWGAETSDAVKKVAGTVAAGEMFDRIKMVDEAMKDMLRNRVSPLAEKQKQLLDEGLEGWIANDNAIKAAAEETAKFMAAGAPDTLENKLGAISAAYDKQRGAITLVARSASNYQDLLAGLGEKQKAEIDAVTEAWMMNGEATKAAQQALADDAVLRYQMMRDSGVATAEQVYRAWEDAYYKQRALIKNTTQMVLSAAASIAGSIGEAFEGIGEGFGSEGLANIGKWLSSVSKGMQGAVGAGSELHKGISAMREGFSVQGIVGVASGIGQSVTAFQEATKEGNAFQKMLGGAATGAQIGSFFGPWGTAIGAAAGGIAGLVKGLMGPSDYEKRIRANAKAIEEMKNTAVEASGGIESFRASWEAIGMGMSFDEFFAIKDPEAFQGLVDQFGTKLPEGLNAMVRNAVLAGEAIPPAMQPIIEQLIRQGQLTQENANLLMGLPEMGIPSYQSVQEAAERYGIALDSLGPKVAGLRITEVATQAVADFNLLMAAGADVNAVLAGMSGELQQIVIDAINTGTALPEALRPILQQLVDGGMLTDAFGTKLADLGGLTFTETIEASVDRLISKLDELINTLVGGVGGAITALSGSEVTVGVRYEARGGIQAPAGGETIEPPPAVAEGEVPSFAGGTHGRYFDFGSGQLALLHGREMVVPEGDEPMGGGGTVVLELDGVRLAEILVPHIPGVVTRYGL